MDNPAIIVTLKDQNATLNFGKSLGGIFPAGTILLLHGDLGAGKTTLVQGIGLGLGIIEPIVSPTFTLVNEYHEGRIPLYHLDLYRLESPDLAPLYLEQYWDGVENPLGIVVIEWAERLSHLPDSYLVINLHHLDQGREAVLTWHGQPMVNLANLII